MNAAAPIARLDSRQPDFHARLATLRAWEPEQDEQIERVVADIVRGRLIPGRYSLLRCPS